MEELKKYPDRYNVHNLYGTYPNEKIDVTKEQQLVETHDKIIFQFPFYWYNCPPLLKKWLDEVLTYGWAYGSKSGYKLNGKKIALGITAGGGKEDYSETGTNGYSVRQFIAPFASSFEYVKAEFKSFFAFYGAELGPTDESIEESTKNYVSFIESV